MERHKPDIQLVLGALISGLEVRFSGPEDWPTRGTRSSSIQVRTYRMSILHCSPESPLLHWVPPQDHSEAIILAALPGSFSNNILSKPNTKALGLITLQWPVLMNFPVSPRSRRRTMCSFMLSRTWSNNLRAPATYFGLGEVQNRPKTTVQETARKCKLN